MVELGRLLWNSEELRFGVVRAGSKYWRDWIVPGLHCGACFEVMLPDGTWQQTRLEYSDSLRGLGEYSRWYLVGTSFSGGILGELHVRADW